jgi:meso-butanediol dehydrogenase / (S,S)-butanediol dehydrogenase / diacetyl reductase
LGNDWVPGAVNSYFSPLGSIGTPRLSGQVALVTGATQAMGEAIASRLAEEGAAIVGIGRNQKNGEAVTRRIREAGFVADFVSADIGREDEVARAVQTAVERFDRIDIVVNNAAAFDDYEAAPHDESSETFDAILKVGLYAPFWFTKYSAPVMIRGGRGGFFANISSYASSRGVLALPAYSASKGGLEALTRQVAMEYASYGIRANSLVLGSIRVPRNARMHEDEEASERLRHTRMIDRPGSPLDVAAAIAFLASSDASFITGAAIPIDGGLLSRTPFAGIAGAVRSADTDEWRTRGGNHEDRL